MAAMAPGLPLPTLHSHLLVAFTIEFDNEAEHRIAHRTSTGPGAQRPGGSPWLVSQVMWVNTLRYVDDRGTRVDDLHAWARTTRTSLTALQRWGYVTLATTTPVRRGDRIPGGARVVTTDAGRAAAAVWRPLAAEIERRWRDRFGAGTVDGLRSSLEVVLGRVGVDLPRYLPVVDPTNNEKTGSLVSPAPSMPDDWDGDGDGDGLPVLLARPLIAFTLESESESRLSLPIGANVLRVLDRTGVRMRDLPTLTGVSREAVAMAVGFLERRSGADLVADPGVKGEGGPTDLPGGTGPGAVHAVLGSTEKAWRRRYGADTVATLRRALEQVAGRSPAGTGSLLFQGIEVYPDGWRPKVRPPQLLPHYPMVLHRGGHPDGR
jgi:hypothetical protein